MKRSLKGNRRDRIRKVMAGLALAIIVLAVSGCHTVRFYGQAIRGQYQIFAHEQPIKKLIAAPETPERLRNRLRLLEDLRAFAREQLKLPVDGHYAKYADVHRPYVVWNVEAAPEFSMQAKTWWYPLVGSLKYRGYFSNSGATNYAAYLRKKGYDVFVGGVEAYSTLGWFKDPVLNTFIFNPDADLAEVIFHELGHQRVFARGDTDFNEAFATTVGQEGARRWLDSLGKSADREAYEAELRHTTEFAQLVTRTRRRLESLYGDHETEDGKVVKANRPPGLPAAKLREQKARILQDLKDEYGQVKAQWNGDRQYEWWFAHPVNNAKLNSVAAYYDFVPGFKALLAENGNDLPKFYKAVEQLSHLPKKERHGKLLVLAQQSQTPAPVLGSETRPPAK